ncbi:MAG TPA: MFS transporter [Chthoniobacterales bacterium]|nr:MFS transporter [Chthoniobacterales bacterium]
MNAPCPPASRKWVLAATILGSSMAFIDGTVVNVALPTLQTNLNASLADVQWVVEAYALVLSAFLLVGGSLGDHYGRRRIFVIGVTLFAAASACCGIAGSIAQLLVARALQGFGAALLVPGSLAIISSAFPEEERGRAIGTWSGFSAITAAIGPVMGGWLIDHVSWRAVFFINLPLAFPVVAIALRHVPESTGNRKGPLDFGGAVLTAFGLGALVFALIESSRLGFAHPAVITSLVTAAICGGGFVLLESRLSAPMLPLDLFRSRTFTGANLLTLFLYGALGGTLFFFPLNLIQVQRYPPTQAGAALLPLILIIFLLSRWSGGLVHRYGARIPLVIGPMIAAVGFTLFMVPGVGGNYWQTFFPAVLVLGLGMAISVAPLTTTVMNSIAQERAGIASGVNNAVSRVAGLLAIALFGIVMLQCFNHALDAKLSEFPVPAAARDSLVKERGKLAAADTTQAPPEIRPAVEAAVAQSFVSAFRRIMLLGALCAAGSALTAWVLIVARPGRALTGDEKKGQADRN